MKALLDHWQAILFWGALALVLFWLLAPARKRLSELTLNSVVENNRFSPRLLTTFAVVGVTLYLELRAAHTAPSVLNGVQVSTWPPEYVLIANLTLIGALLGLGKLADTYKTVQLNKTVPDTEIKAGTAKIDVAGDANFSGTSNPQHPQPTE